MKETQHEICKITGKVPENGKKFQWCQLCCDLTNETNKMQLFLKTSSIKSSRHKQTNTLLIFLFFKFYLISSDYPSDGFKKRKRKKLIIIHVYSLDCSI